MNTRKKMAESGNGNEWVSGISRNRLSQGYLLSGFLAIVALLFIFVLNDSSPDAQLIGIAQLFFAGLIFLFTYRNGARSGRLLVMNHEGIWYQDWKAPAVPWSHISAVGIGGTRIKASANVTLKNPDHWLNTLDQGDRTSVRKNPLVVLPVLRIPNGHVDAPLEEVVRVAHSHLSTHPD